ncbi:MAG TPA: MoaD/ThiS family protein [Thermoplasmata archaeon]|nr:MoaD/ThiS family protein [Thermoplasmata archaeon]
MSSRVTVLLFATARLAVGRGELQWPVGADGVRIGILVRNLRERYPKLAPILRTCRFVVNGRYVSSRATRLRPGDEFAVHPPYGGG